MKSFLEEYGFAILAAIVVILLIAMATPVGNLIKEQVMGMVNKFSGSADKKLDASMGGEFSAMLTRDADGIIKLNLASPSDTNTFTYVTKYKKNGGEFKTSDVKGGPDGIKNGVHTVNNEGADSGSELYVIVTDKGTGETFQSNTVKVK